MTVKTGGPSNQAAAGQTLAEIIREVKWTKKVRQANEEALILFFDNYYGGRSGEKSAGKSLILQTAVSELVKDPEIFSGGIVDGVYSYPNDKYALTVRLGKLLQHLRDKYGLMTDEKIFKNFKCRDKDARLLEILKYLHAGEKSREEIAAEFGISVRSLATDLAELQDGYDFMGCHMQITQVERKKNTYRSIIHPVFLAMNNAEMYAMTVGLKLLSRGTVFETTLGRVADEIYAQCSPVAREMIDGHRQEQQVDFGDDDRKFINTYNLMREQRRQFAYFLREPVPCRVTYTADDQEKTATGTLHLPEEKNSAFRRVMVRPEDGDDFILDMDQVLSLEAR